MAGEGSDGTVGPIDAYRFNERGGLPVLTFPALAERGVTAVITTRAGGVSTGPYDSLNLGLHVGDDPAAVVENRRRAAAAVHSELDDLVFCNQAHGRVVVTVDAAARGRGARSMGDAVDGADALVTTSPEVTLAVLVADCVPMVLHHPAGVLACVHAGWRGTVADVAGATVEAMAALGADPAAIVAAVGPAVAPDRYEVGDDVAAAARDRFGDGADLDDVLHPHPDGRWRFDLWAANRHLLRRAGVAEANITVADVATGSAGGDRFFSDRQARPCGRFAAVAHLAA
jgi:YfiH family protein